MFIFISFISDKFVLITKTCWAMAARLHYTTSLEQMKSPWHICERGARVECHIASIPRGSAQSRTVHSWHVLRVTHFAKLKRSNYVCEALIYSIVLATNLFIYLLILPTWTLPQYFGIKSRVKPGQGLTWILLNHQESEWSKWRRRHAPDLQHVLGDGGGAGPHHQLVHARELRGVRRHRQPHRHPRHVSLHASHRLHKQ